VVADSADEDVEGVKGFEGVDDDEDVAGGTGVAGGPVGPGVARVAGALRGGFDRRTGDGRRHRSRRGAALDEPRLERLFRAEFARLVHAVAIVVGDVEAAADVVQEAFLQASRHWPRIATYENPAAWLQRVAINRALDERRRDRRWRAALPRLAGLAPAAALPAPTEGPLDFDAAVARLPRQQRAVVALFYGADLPVAEVAGVLGIAEGTVKSYLHDARRALAPRLEVDDGQG
jgi:RNA polymerase sigma-70 factor (ECF subfamily)